MFRNLTQGALEPDELAVLQRVFDQLSVEAQDIGWDQEEVAARLIIKYQAGLRDEAALLDETRAACLDLTHSQMEACTAANGRA